MNFDFATATRVVFGAGKIGQLVTLAHGFGSRVLVVSGSRPAAFEMVSGLLEPDGIASTRFVVGGEPTTELVQQGVAAARAAGCEFVIAIGGGSVIDAGKAIAAMLANEGELLDYLEVVGRGKTLNQPSRPCITVPTTAGTGTEVTRNSVLASPEHRVKVSLRSPYLLPTIALVDPELTYDLPAPLTATTGLDALTQLIEPFTCNRANPVTDAICREGLPRAAWALRAAFQDGTDRAAREDMALASLFGGLALANAGLGAVHGFAAPIGGMFPAPHGAVCAALLPHVMAVNVAALRALDDSGYIVRRYEEVARILTNNPGAKPEDAVQWMRTLVQELGIPGLSRYGVKPGNISALVAGAKQASSMKANPVKLSDEELTGILEAAL